MRKTHKSILRVNQELSAHGYQYHIMVYQYAAIGSSTDTTEIDGFLTISRVPLGVIDRDMIISTMQVITRQYIIKHVFNDNPITDIIFAIDGLVTLLERSGDRSFSTLTAMVALWEDAALDI